MFWKKISPFGNTIYAVQKRGFFFSNLAILGVSSRQIQIHVSTFATYGSNPIVMNAVHSAEPKLLQQQNNDSSPSSSSHFIIDNTVLVARFNAVSDLLACLSHSILGAIADVYPSASSRQLKQGHPGQSAVWFFRRCTREALEEEFAIQQHNLRRGSSYDKPETLNPIQDKPFSST